MLIRNVYRTMAFMLLMSILCAQSQCEEKIQKPEVYAFLIGIDKYDEPEFPTLKGCIKDVSSVFDVLTHNGVTKDHIIVMRTEDTESPNSDMPPISSNMLPKTSNIYKTLDITLKKWKDQVSANDWLLFFYSGHGIQAEGGDWIVPMDARKDFLSDLAIPILDVEKRIRNNWKGEQFLCFYDMCRSEVDINAILSKIQDFTLTDGSESSQNGEYQESGRGSSLGDSTYSDQSSEAHFMSCLPFNKASDRGYLTKAFVSAINEQNLDLRSLSDYVGRKVNELSHGNQRLDFRTSLQKRQEEMIFPLGRSLRIESDPPGATVHIEGKVVGTTPCLVRKTVESSENKNVDILVKAIGYQGHKEEGVQLSEDMNAPALNVILKPIERFAGFVALNCIDDSEMVYVTSGQVKMDITQDGKKKSDESELQGYWISRYEITEKQFQTFLKATGTKDPRGKLWEDSKQDYNLPAVKVTSELAKKYCEWAEGRLPSEAEWMRAARGDQNWIYPWGNDWKDNACNYKGKKLMSVGTYSKHPSPFGCYDMAGNVMEIVTSKINSKDFVYKGGYSDCNRYKEETKASYRKQPDKDETTIQWCGFRVVKTNEP